MLHTLDLTNIDAFLCTIGGRTKNEDFIKTELEYPTQFAKIAK